MKTEWKITSIRNGVVTTITHSINSSGDMMSVFKTLSSNKMDIIRMEKIK